MDVGRGFPTEAAGEGATRERAVDPSTFDHLLRLGDLHRSADNHGEALGHYLAAREPLGAPEGPNPDGVDVVLRIVDCHASRGELGMARAAIAEAEAFAGPHPDDVTRARIIGRHAIVGSMSGQYQAAIDAAREALSLLRETTSSEVVRFQARLYLAIGHALERQGRTGDAEQSFDLALGLYERVGDRRGIAHAYNNLGLNRKQSNHLRDALSFLHRALDILEDVGDYGRKASICLNLGIIHSRLGDWPEARRQLERATQIAREIDHRGRLVKSLIARGVLDMRSRRFGAARATLEEADAIAEANGYTRERILVEEFRGELEVATGQPERGRDRLLVALADARELAPAGDLVSEIGRRLAEAHFALGDLDAATETAERTIEIAESLGDLTEAAAARRVLGLCRARAGRCEDGHAMLGAVLETFRKLGARYEVGRTHLSMARVCLDVARESTDAHPEIQHHLTEARAIFETLDVPGHLAEVALAAVEDRIRTGPLDDAENLLRSAARYVEASEESPLLEEQMRLKARLDQRARTSLEGSDILSPTRELHRLLKTSESPESAVDALLRMVLRRTSSDRAFLAQGPTTEDLTVVGAIGTTAAQASELLGRIQPAVAASMASGYPAIRAPGDADVGDVEDVSGLAIAPLCLPQDIWGLLYVDRRAQHVVGAYRQADLKLIALLAELASISALALERTQMLSERARLESGIDASRLTRPIVSASPAFEALLQTVRKVSDSPASVLVRGETGTGKGLIARAVHDTGRRREAPFVPISCAAIPEHLLESELFGHMAGAFTGAIREKRGLFEEAEGGTVFLDEVDKTTRAVQAKLLHVLDHHEIRPVGATRWKRVDVRIVSATNANLKTLIAENAFLEDLYYRLNDISIVIPPLRERRQDIDALVDHFMATFSAEMSRDVPRLSPDVMRLLHDYAWPGNVRELEKAVRRMLVLADEGEPVGVAHLPPELVGPAGVANGATNGSMRSAVQRLERQMIVDALRECRGNKSAAARRLAISYPTLLAKVRTFAID